MRYMRISTLKPGMITASHLYDNSGRLMLAANCALTANLIRRLDSLKFHGAYVLDSRDDHDYRPLLDDQFRLDAIQTLKGLDIDQLIYVANAITNQVMFSTDRLYDMQAVCDYDSLTYMHCVNVAVLSVMTGVAMGLDNDSLLELGQGALLHDIGKTMVDPRIIKGSHRLSDEEFKEVRRHPKYGYDMLARCGAVSENVRLAVLHHHEKEDGTGYPSRLSGSRIPLYAKIIHVADVYDALVSARSYKKRMNPADALENLMAGAGTDFDTACVDALRSSVALYPVGTKVRLSNGSEAYVKENHKGYPSRPLLSSQTGIPIDLLRRDRLNVTIVGFAD